MSAAVVTGGQVTRPEVRSEIEVKGKVFRPITHHLGHSNEVPSTQREAVLSFLSTPLLFLCVCVK